MFIKIGFGLYVLLIHQILQIQTDEICYYTNQSVAVSIYCSGSCCSGMSSSAQTACCSSVSWSTLAVPTFVVTGICLLAICLVYFRPLLKICCCGCRCPFGNRSRVTSANSTVASDNPVYIMNNRGLPDYETVIKDSRPKDLTPPPYNFVAAHPTDFGIDARVPSAPPQYRSRCNSIATAGQVPAPVQI